MFLTHNNNGVIMKKIIFILLFFSFVGNIYSSNIYISKRDIDTDEYVLDCDFILTDNNGNIIDSWIQDNSDHILNINNGLYNLISRPYIMGEYQDSMAFTYKLNVDKDSSFVIYNKEIYTPPNLSYNMSYSFCFVFVVIGILVIIYSKFSYL